MRRRRSGYGKVRHNALNASGQSALHAKAIRGEHDTRCALWEAGHLFGTLKGSLNEKFNVL